MCITTEREGDKQLNGTACFNLVHFNCSVKPKQYHLLDSPYGELQLEPPNTYFIDLRQMRANFTKR